MREYLVITASIISIMLIIYDYFTKKLTEGVSIGSKVFKLFIYLTAMITIIQTIMNQMSKLADY